MLVVSQRTGDCGWTSSVKGSEGKIAGSSESHISSGLHANHCGGNRSD